MTKRKGVSIHSVVIDGEVYLKKSDILRYFSWLKKPWKDFPMITDFIEGVRNEIKLTK